MTECFLGIDTSNYTTSAALCSFDGEVIANLKIPLPVREGECGLRQSDAVFSHVRNLPSIMEQLRAQLPEKKILAVGVSAFPRRAEGSYMPCFLAGRAAAESFAAALQIPVFTFSHQEGHIMAALYASGAGERLLSAERFAAFHVSGGTTEVLLSTPDGNGFSVELIGKTEDLNAGQAIDRVGVMMGLRFPCGREMEMLANTFSGKLPKPRISVKDGSCNLSGLQNLSEKLWRETADKPMVSAFVFSFLGETLAAMTAHIDACYGNLPIVYAGGVMSNVGLQRRLCSRENTYFAEASFSSDNAAGTALLCRARYLRKS
ncbi:MAG: peptidase M22 [Ruminococcaceae bacterium]|nr:peptidase M22 [Oscillospiraceae bacterium]